MLKLKWYRRAVFLQAGVESNLQLLDLLQLTRQEKEIKELCKRSIAELHAWEKSGTLSSNPVLRPYIKMSQAVMRRQARDAVKVYKAIRLNRMKLFDTYINELQTNCPIKRLAS